MKAAFKEESLETELCDGLVSQGWIQKDPDAPSGYDPKRALYPQDIRGWLETSGQLKGLDDKTEDELLTLISLQIKKIGVIQVLKTGIRFRGKHLRLAQFRPKNQLNAKLQKRYRANILRVERQLYYSTRNRNCIDVVGFLNGIPIWTAELKSAFTQSVQTAVKQYGEDRLPEGEPLLQHTPAHFAIDTEAIFATSKLAGESTRFIPFSDPDAGIQFFWTVLGKRSETLNLVENFFSYRGYMPKYNQWEAVRRVIEDFKRGPERKRYLMEHSPGSGKTMIMALLAHQLVTLHDDHGNLMVDLAIVVTNREILDSQAAEAVSEAEDVRGMVKHITGSGSSKAKQLRSALDDGTKIITVTQQTFLHLDSDPEFRKLMKEKRCAVIIDEAQASQTGQLAQIVDDRLSGRDEEGEEDALDYLAEKLRANPEDKTAYIAFTATPKKETLEIFGRDGKPFHTYTMLQAEKEGAIMRVLDDLRFYGNEGRVLAKGEQFRLELVDKEPGKRSVINWINNTEEILRLKLKLGVPAWLEADAGQMDGGGKLMIAAQSRQQAAELYRLYEELRKENDWPAALVSFTGTVEIDGEEVSEGDLNGFPGDVAKRFDGDDYRVMIVADKYQVGFDQPRLTGLITNKTITEPSAIVQTYSRVNRIYPGKQRTTIIDFINEPDAVLEAFALYRGGSALGDPVPSHSEIEEEIATLGVLEDSDFKVFQKLMHGPEAPTQTEWANKVFIPIKKRYRQMILDPDRSPEERAEIEELPGLLRQWSRAYGVYRLSGREGISQELDDRREFYDELRSFLDDSVRRKAKNIDLDGKLELEHAGLLERERKQSPSPESGSAGEISAEYDQPEKRKVYLQSVIDEVNARLDRGGPAADPVIRELVEGVASDEMIRSQALANERKTFLGSRQLDAAIAEMAWELASENEGSGDLMAEIGKEETGRLIREAIYEEIQAIPA